MDELHSLPHDIQKNVAIPHSIDSSSSGSSSSSSSSLSYSSCHRYDLNFSSFDNSAFLAWNRSTIVSPDSPVVECDRWTYDTTTFESTIVSKVNTSGQGFIPHFKRGDFEGPETVLPRESGGAALVPHSAVESGFPAAIRFAVIFVPNFAIYSSTQS